MPSDSTSRRDSFDRGLPQDPALRKTAQRFFDALFDHYPMWATELGLHDWDGALTDWSPAARTRYAHTLDDALGMAQAVDPDRLDKLGRAESQVLTTAIRLALDDEREDPGPRRDPNIANALVSSSLLPLMRMASLPIEGRARHAADRLAQVPDLVQHQAELLDNPPRLFVDVALQQYRDTLPFLEEAVPAAFQDAPPPVRSRIEEESRRARDAYRRFLRRLEELALHAGGSFALGEERYRTRLRLIEHIETPLPDLLAQGYSELARLTERLMHAVTALRGDASPREVVHDLYRQGPPADRLLKEAAGVLDELRDFCRAKRLVSIPDAPHPAVVETPAFMRAATFASIAPPGPFESAQEAYYQVTLPDPSASPEDQAAHLGGFNPWGLRIITAHEVYPGHYLQFLHVRRTPSTILKALPSGAFVEGWAHYTEELLLEQGFGGGRPEMLLSQSMEALERVGRFLMGIRLHIGDVSHEEAVRFFESECFMEPVAARREALRGTMDPFYLIYTLGKLGILDLRRDWTALHGHGGADLESFHGELLGHGYPPLPVLRELMGVGTKHSNDK